VQVGERRSLLRLEDVADAIRRDDRLDPRMHQGLEHIHPPAPFTRGPPWGLRSPPTRLTAVLVEREQVRVVHDRVDVRSKLQAALGEKGELD